MVPPFHAMGEYQFEDLCRDLINQEQDVDTADWYGVRGQAQKGIDILVRRCDGSHAGAQCKSHKECDKALIRDACSEFLKHANHWRQEGVNTFILCLAADTRRTQLHDERSRQRNV